MKKLPQALEDTILTLTAFAVGSQHRVQQRDPDDYCRGFSAGALLAYQSSLAVAAVSAGRACYAWDAPPRQAAEALNLKS